MILAAAIEFLKGEGFLKREIQAPRASLERPGLIHGQKEEDAFYPDIHVNQKGKQIIFDIDPEGKGKIRKWKAFSNFVKSKSGEFFIIAPKSRFNKLSKLLKRNKIEAEIIDIV